jgi:hydroxymethylglutaryl-CoA lyase
MSVQSSVVSSQSGNRIVLHEVGPRDGLQMEHTLVPVERKMRWVQDLLNSGMDIVQVGSFVHPTKVPQMADTDQMVRDIIAAGTKPAAVTLSGLVLNEKGLDRALACGVEMVCMGVSASETHSKKNTGMPIAEATDRIIATAHAAHQAGKAVQVSVQSAFGCGFEGAVPHHRVVGIVQRFLDAGLRHLSLADTAGYATPDQVERLYGEVFALDPGVEWTCHFHNTYGLGIANCLAAMRAGVTTIETSVAGLGGCPFTKIAGGNVCTEDFVHMLQLMGLRKDVRLATLIAVAEDVAAFFNKEMPGMVYRTGSIPALSTGVPA